MALISRFLVLSVAFGFVTLPGAQAVNFFFEHGLSSNPVSGFGVSGNGCVNDGNSHDGGTYGSACQLFAPYGQVTGLYHNENDATMQTTIPAQSASLAEAINSGSANTDYVLIGSSQGGLRSRYVAQTPGVLTDAARNHLKAIVTFDSPHTGALLLQNLLPYIGGIDTELRISSLGFLNVKSLLNSIPAAKDVVDLTNRSGNEPGLVDLKVGSTFLNQLNGVDCRWVTQRKNMGSKKEPEWEEYQISVCSQGYNFPKIPTQTALVSVVGTATQNANPNSPGEGNTLEAYIWGAGSGYDLRGQLGQYSSIAGTVGAGSLGAYAVICAATMGFGCLFGAPVLALGVVQLDLSHHLANFFPEWRTNVVGEQTGDSVVGTSSQSYMFSQPLLGGDRNRNATVPSNAAHALTQVYFAKPREDARDYLRSFNVLP